MVNQTAIIGRKGRRRTYADLVLHGTAKPVSDSEESNNEEDGSSEDELIEEEHDTNMKDQGQGNNSRGDKAPSWYRARKLQDGTISIQVSKAREKVLERPWKKALIIKLLGRRVAYGVLKRRLEYMWAKIGGMDLINVGNDYFIVRLFNEDDY
ncbi:hypothetical protein PIB30_057647, partial [Stylosanthes scabra]|nr:hypothetical protein [Stylosanthes scabra]